MESFRCLFAFCCLAVISVRYSEAALAWDTATEAVSVSECAATGTTIAYTRTTSGATTAPVSYALNSVTPTSTPAKFAVASSTGVLTTSTDPTNMLNAATQATYAVVIRASDSSGTPETADLTLTVTVTACSFGMKIMPSLILISMSILGLFLKL